MHSGLWLIVLNLDLLPGVGCWRILSRRWREQDAVLSQQQIKAETNGTLIPFEYLFFQYLLFYLSSIYRFKLQQTERSLC